MQNIINQLVKSTNIQENLLKNTKTEVELLILVTNYVQELINTNIDKLMFVLYKIDVSEKKIKIALANPTTENSAEIIAKEIIEREKEKIATREKYSSGDSGSDWIF